MIVIFCNLQHHWHYNYKIILNTLVSIIPSVVISLTSESVALFVNNLLVTSFSHHNSPGFYKFSIYSNLSRFQFKFIFAGSHYFFELTVTEGSKAIVKVDSHLRSSDFRQTRNFSNLLLNTKTLTWNSMK